MKQHTGQQGFNICYLLLCMAQLGKTQNGSSNVEESLQLFTKDLYRNVAIAGNNVIVSPLSLFSALSMLALGAKGSTFNELEGLLYIKPDTFTRNKEMTRKMFSIKPPSSDEITMEMANFLWVPRGVIPNADYDKSIGDIFKTRVRNANFSGAEETISHINTRVSQITRNNIKDFLLTSSITSQTRMLLVNVLYFKGKWLHPFEESNTFPEPFFMDDGQTVNTPMMHLKDTFRGGFLKELNSKAILLPYAGNRFGLLCVLPERNSRLHDLENSLLNSGHTPTTLMRRMIARDVNVTFPKFKINSNNVEMTEVLKQMGAKSLFSNNADFSGMISNGTSSPALKVSHVYHQSTFEVNEGGSEASAASGVEVTLLIGGFGGYHGPMDFRADRPFLFYLIDQDNENIPIFMGRMYNPTNMKVYNHNISSNLTSRHDGLNNPIKTENTSTKINRSILRQPSQATSSNANFDSVILTEKPKVPTPNFNFYNRFRQSGEANFFRTPSRQEVANPIMFPDYDRIRREEIISFDHDTNVNDTVLLTSTTSPNDTLNTRVKDSNWFNKPTLSEVIVPINTPDKHLQETNVNNQPSSSSMESHTPFLVVANPERSTTPPNILEQAQAPVQIQPAIMLFNSWIGPPGFPPANNFPPTLIGSSSVSSSQTEFHFPSHSPVFNPSVGSQASIFFPEIRSSSKKGSSDIS